MSSEWERGCVRDRSLVAHCPSYAGSCVSVHTPVFSLNSNIKTAQVSPTLPLRQLSASHHKCTMDCASNQCLDQGPLQTRFSINMYILVLTPLHLPPRPSFFPSYSRTVLFFFFFLFASCCTWSQFFCWGVESLHSVFKWRGKICILYFPVLFFPPCPAACMLHFSPLLRSSPPHSSPPSSCYVCPPLVHRLFVSAANIQLACSISFNSSSFHLPWLSATFSHKKHFSHWARESEH